MSGRSTPRGDDRTRLAALPFNYAHVGATSSLLPAGQHRFRVRRPVGSGQADFEQAGDRLMTWDMHRRAGVRVDADGPVSTGGVALLGLRIGPWWVDAPVRVLDVITDASVRGFSYGTLRGHPERGEERFTVCLGEDGVVMAEICAFSRPGRWFTYLAGPVARHLQARTTRRYVLALGP